MISGLRICCRVTFCEPSTLKAVGDAEKKEEFDGQYWYIVIFYLVRLLFISPSANASVNVFVLRFLP
jgi:hypothetical protein